MEKNLMKQTRLLKKTASEKDSKGCAKTSLMLVVTSIFLLLIELIAVFFYADTFRNFINSICSINLDKMD